MQFESSSARLAWLAAAFLYALCAVTRLGFYNVHNVQSRFVGLPTTLAALLWSTLFLMHPAATPSALILIVIGLAMVSWLPVSRPQGVTRWAYMVWFAGVFVSYAARLADYV